MSSVIMPARAKALLSFPGMNWVSCAKTFGITIDCMSKIFSWRMYDPSISRYNYR